MKSATTCVLALALVLQCLAIESVEKTEAHHHKHHAGHHKGKHHHGHHHKGPHHHHKHHDASKAAAKAAVPAAVAAQAAVKPAAAAVAKAVPVLPKAAVQLSGDEKLVAKMKVLEARLAQKKKAQAVATQNGNIMVSGPIPTDFAQRFSQAVGAATASDAKKVLVIKTAPVKGQPDIFAVDFSASPKVVTAVETQATDPDSKLASGNMHSFLVSKDDDEEKEDKEEKKVDKKEHKAPKKVKTVKPEADEEPRAVTPVEQKGIDIDTAMPYGDLEPFGREDTAQELTENSVQESDEMVDQLERAEVAEEKRSVFRALTRLRGAAITSFDGVARSQTGNIDEYNKVHKWRNNHPLHHLADEESDISKWAFPDNADF